MTTATSTTSKLVILAAGALVVEAALPAHCFQNSRIVGGSEATEREFSWQVGLTDGAYMCGGVLIGPKHVLTAAHCQESMTTVVIGAHSRFYLGSEECREQRTVVKRITHPDYFDKVNDIAILELDVPSEYRPIKLFTGQPGITDLEAAGQMLTTSGWGRTSESGGTADTLQKVTVPVISNDECQEMYPRETIDASVLCAAGPGKDSCGGDSGGPIFGTDAYGDDYLVGLVSWGYGCARAESPGVYARVSHFKGWICDNSGGLYGCHDSYGNGYWANWVYNYWYNFWVNWWQNYLSSLFRSSSKSIMDVDALPEHLPRGIFASGPAADAARAAAAHVAFDSADETLRVGRSDGGRTRLRDRVTQPELPAEAESELSPSLADFLEGSAKEEARRIMTRAAEVDEEAPRERAIGGLRERVIAGRRG